MHRKQLANNISKLSNANRLMIVKTIESVNPDALVYYDDGTMQICIDSLSMKQFAKVDFLTRKHALT